MKKIDKKIADDPFEDSHLHIPEAPETSHVYEVFQSLTDDEIEEMLHLIISEVSPERLYQLANGLHTPGAFDLVFDEIGYYHFFPVVKDIG
jgi:hypothetical protein